MTKTTRCWILYLCRIDLNREIGLVDGLLLEMQKQKHTLENTMDILNILGFPTTTAHVNVEQQESYRPTLSEIGLLHVDVLLGKIHRGFKKLTVCLNQGCTEYGDKLNVGVMKKTVTLTNTMAVEVLKWMKHGKITPHLFLTGLSVMDIGKALLLIELTTTKTTNLKIAGLSQIQSNKEIEGTILT